MKYIYGWKLSFVSQLKVTFYVHEIVFKYAFLLFVIITKETKKIRHVINKYNTL